MKITASVIHYIVKERERESERWVKSGIREKERRMEREGKNWPCCTSENMEEHQRRENRGRENRESERERKQRERENRERTGWEGKSNRLLLTRSARSAVWH